MLNEVVHVGPIRRDYAGGVVDGLLLVLIGRFSMTTAYYTWTTSVNQGSCNFYGFSWRTRYYAGAHAGPGDSGTGIGHLYDESTPYGCRTVVERVGILWRRQSKWSYVHSFHQPELCEIGTRHRIVLNHQNTKLFPLLSYFKNKVDRFEHRSPMRGYGMRFCGTRMREGALRQ